MCLQRVFGPLGFGRMDFLIPGTNCRAKASRPTHYGVPCVGVCVFSPFSATRFEKLAILTLGSCKLIFMPKRRLVCGSRVSSYRVQ